MNKNRIHIQVALFPLARTTFSMPDAEALYRRSRRMLRQLFGEIHCPETLLTSPEDAGAFADSLTVAPDLVVYQCNTFVGADFVTPLMRWPEAPVLLWAPEEPSIDGGRLKLNSLTGVFAAANRLHQQGRSYCCLLGNPEDGAVRRRWEQIRSTLQTVGELRRLKVGVVGAQPDGFEFGAMDRALPGCPGLRIVTTGVEDILAKAAACPPETIARALDELKAHTRGWETTPADTLEKHARLRGAYQAFIDEHGLGAVASRCWPDFFSACGTALCTVLSLLNDHGTATACEADIPGAISMFIGAELSGGAVYLGDPVAVDTTCNALVFWHCGAGATTLARNGAGARLGLHPNRQIGPSLEFGLKSGRVTVLRLGKHRDRFRLMAMAGEALDEPQKFCGTSVAVRPREGLAAQKSEALLRDGWEPHFVVAYGDITEELQWMCELLNLEFLMY
jgi:L-fucose isomerase-like protein